MFQSLLKYSSIFLKEAGLLKVPENLLQEVQSWAESAYFTKVLSLINERFVLRNKRNILIDSVYEKSEDLRYKILKEAVVSKNIDPILSYIDSTNNDFDFSLGKFNQDIDAKTQLQGVYDNKLFSFHIQVSKDDNGYEFYFSSYLLGKKKNYFLKRNLSYNELQKEFQENVTFILEEIINDFDLFLKYVEDSGTDRLVKKQLVECNRYIKEKIDINSVDVGIGKEFNFIHPLLNLAVSVWVNFIFENKEDKTGDWSEGINKKKDKISVGNVKLYYKPKIPSSLDEFQIIADAIQKTVRHELQHMVQTIINKSMYPVLEKNYNPREETIGGKMPTFPIQLPKIIRDNIIPEKIKQDEDLEHAHRSVEYHTRVADSVANFKSVINKLPKIIHKAFFEAWINHNSSFEDFFDKLNDFEIPDPREKYKTMYGEFDFEFNFEDAYEKLKRNSKMFKSFKEHDFEKYKFAVKEFYKEVQDLL